MEERGAGGGGGGRGEEFGKGAQIRLYWSHTSTHTPTTEGIEGVKPPSSDSSVIVSLPDEGSAIMRGAPREGGHDDGVLFSVFFGNFSSFFFRVAST